MPSSRPEPRSTEEHLRSRRRQLKRHIDSYPKACIGCLGRSLVQMWIVLLLLALAAWTATSLWERYSMVLPHVKHVSPGMTENEVISLFPRRMHLDSRETATPRPGTHLAAEAHPVARELEVRGSRTPAWLDFLMALLDSDWDGATVYFDSDGHVAGLYYNAYHSRWQPDWGPPVESSPCGE